MDLKTLTELNGISGDEGLVRRALMEAARPHCDEISIDRSGNLICKKKGSNPELPEVLFAAHMDEVGFIIAGYADDGLLRIRPVGGIDPRVIVSKWVQVGPDKVPGVIGAMAIHLQTDADRKKVLDYDSLYIDIGAKDKAEAEKLAPLGTYAAFDTAYMPFGEGMVIAKALDDRVGCYNMLRLLEGSYPCDITCCFVTQEEVGLRGSIGAAYAIEAEVALVFEGTAANDMGDVPESQRVCQVGHGVTVSFMDGASVGNRELFKLLPALAENAGIPCQIKQGVTGGNDAGSFQYGGATGAGTARTMVLSVPCRYIHSGASVAALSDIDAQLHLAQEYLNNL